MSRLLSLIVAFGVLLTGAVVTNGQITVIDERTVKVEARGHAEKGGRKKKQADAREDAIRNAIQMVVNDLIRDPEVAARFEQVKSDFYADYEMFMLDYEILRKTEEGKRLNLHVAVTLNKDLINQKLVQLQVIESAKDMRKELDRFTIMPYLDLEQSSPEAEEWKELFYTRFRVFFEDKGIPTVGQEEVMAAEKDESFLAELQGSEGEEDPALILARNTPADIFVKIVGKIEKGSYAGTETYKVILTVGAYAVLTGEFIGSNNGFSQPMALSSPGASISAGIDEAMNNTMPKVLERMTNFWRDFVAEGRPIKVLFTNFGFKEKRDIKEALETLTNDQKLLKSAGNVIEYMVWYDDSPEDLMYELYDMIGMDQIGLARDPQVISSTVRFQAQ
ncbi:hypothetical protein GF324_01335 [bacterium]|nr:hypothetical protein [bacterium]